MMSKGNHFLIFLLTFLCVTRLSLQCLPPLGWTPPSLEDKTRRAPLVVRASLLSKTPGNGGNLFESFGHGSSYTACLNVTHVFKGVLPAGDICAGGFGEPVFCKTDLAFGVSYVIFLNTDPLSARYEFIAPAAHVFTQNVFAEVEKGVCCPRETSEEPFRSLKDEDKVKINVPECKNLICPSTYKVPKICQCSYNGQ